MRIPYSFLDSKLSASDDIVFQVIEFEKRRQQRKLIMIASESICPQPVLEAQASVFSNIYAEGYPPQRMDYAEREIVDCTRYLTHYRRYGDQRYYKGCEYANLIENLAQTRARELFIRSSDLANDENVWVNVQPLSGAAANNSVYNAFVKPGDTIMGMALPHGGHLTHGSKVNRSGKLFHSVSYRVDTTTNRIDYQQVEQLAHKHRPKLIIAGASAFPWEIDWQKFRAIADSVNAILLADIAHTSGLVAAGLFPNPLGHAHIVNMTTHKTLCGPRAAITLTTDAKIARQIDKGIFPGEQGGPHVNTIAAVAVALKLALTKEFQVLMRQVVNNAVCLARAIEKRGLQLAYGGTNTHLCLIDLRSLKSDSKAPITGDVAADVLDLCGITCNKNTIPGDVGASAPSAIRLGTTWLTQLGMGPAEMEQIADIISMVLKNIQPYIKNGYKKKQHGGKIPFALLMQARRAVAAITDCANHPPYPVYPHYYHLQTGLKRLHISEIPLLKSISSGEPADSNQLILLHNLENGLLEISGRQAEQFIAQVISGNSELLQKKQGIRTFLFNADGTLIDDVHIFRCDDSEPRFWIITTGKQRDIVKEWLRSLADGYVVVDEQVIATKIPGPVAVRDLHESAPAMTILAVTGAQASLTITALAADLSEMPCFSLQKVCIDDVQIVVGRTGFIPSQVIYEIYLQQEYIPIVVEKLRSAATNLAIGTREHWLDLRQQAHLPPAPNASDIQLQNFPGYVDFSKPYFVGMHALQERYISEKEYHSYTTYCGEVRSTPLHNEHRQLTPKRLLPFAGWQLPVLYTSIREEHRAVRNAVALFDVTHMGILEIAGPQASCYLNLVTTNDINQLQVGQSQYSFLLSPDAHVVDDIMIYRRQQQRFMLVVNAANAEKVLDWLTAIAAKSVVIEPQFPKIEIHAVPNIQDLRDVRAQDRRLVDIALQGPNSLNLLQKLVATKMLHEQLAHLKKAHFIESELAAIPVIIARTGYTGEHWGFELYVHPDNASKLWNILLDVGAEFAIKPAGLGARDATRIEAGYPLYGHELAGEFAITPMEAGYAAFVKYYKPFFIGKRALFRKDQNSRWQIVCFALKNTGVRKIKHGAQIVDNRGRLIGVVTSCTFVDNSQLGMGYVHNRYTAKGTWLGILNIHQDTLEINKPVSEWKWFKDTFPITEPAVVISRFPLRRNAKRRK